jgi:hypothetical protein
MGFFDKMFEKKECAICGTELGLLGKTKISEGYLCKECAGKLSPYFHGYRSSTADDIREQLAYREANAERLASFNPTRTLSAGRTNIMLDEDAGLLIITSQSRWRDANPDIIEFSQVLGCDMDIDEQRTEIYRETKDGERESYNPPRYDLDYDFNLTIHVNTPYFTEINLRVNDSTIDQRGSIEYREAKRQATEVRDALVQLRQETRDSVVAAKAPQDRGHLPLLRCNHHSRCQRALRILRRRHRRIASGSERTDHGLRKRQLSVPRMWRPPSLCQRRAKARLRLLRFAL